MKNKYSKSLFFTAGAVLCLLAPLEVVLLLLTGLAGCAKEQQFKTVEPIYIPNKDVQKAMQIAEDVLGEMHFTIAKADAELGVIRTRPLTGAQFFEFWRSDNIGAYSSVEANLHSIRRIVELDISQQGQKLRISCDVNVQRLSLPERGVSSSGRAYSMFTESSSSIQRLKLNPEQKKGMAWVDLGRDQKLATEILRRIENRAKRE